jgi:trimeric autotransporter adhesin
MATGDDGIHAGQSVVINGDVVNITKSYEGIESASITVNNGSVYLASTDDGFNATRGQATESNDGSQLTINGGNVVVNSSAGDGLDSNGNASITGGTVIVHGPQSQPEVGFDVNGTFSVSGGLLIGSGPNSGNMIEAPSTSSSQNSIKVTITSSLSSSTLFHIQDSNGKDLVTFKPLRTQYYIVFSSPELVGSSTYNIYTGGSCSGTRNNGLYSSGSYSGGTLKKSFAISSRVTNVSI